MAFKNPWGKGSSKHDRWFSNSWDSVAHTANNLWDENSLMNSALTSVGEFDFPHRSVPEVISLALKYNKEVILTGQVSTVNAKAKERGSRISEVKTSTLARTQEERDAIDRMDVRFVNFINSTHASGFDPYLGPFNYTAQDVADEEADITLISESTNLAMTATVAKQFIDAVRNYEDKRAIHSEEIIEYARLDHEFSNREVLKLIKAIPRGPFRAADIKAFISQESSDLTNKALWGITDKSLGIVINSPNSICNSCKGIGQMQPAARDEAISWAAKKGVTIASNPDPRSITQKQ